MWLNFPQFSISVYVIPPPVHTVPDRRNRFKKKMGNYCLSCGCLLFMYQINWSDMNWLMNCVSMCTVDAARTKENWKLQFESLYFKQKFCLPRKFKCIYTLTHRHTYNVCEMRWDEWSRESEKEEGKATVERNERRKKQHEVRNIL